MKNDFRKMEDEMDELATNMARITEFSARISDTLQDRRQQITQLSGVHTLLKKVLTADDYVDDVMLVRACCAYTRCLNCGKNKRLGP